MFHVKHLLRRKPRPRLLGKRRPTYTAQAADVFINMAVSASAAVRTKGEGRTQALDDMETAVQGCRLYANHMLMHSVHLYRMNVHLYTEGRIERNEVDSAERNFFSACREALGIKD